MSEPVLDKTKMVMPTEVWSRIVGYFRPTQNWGPGKKQEFEDRKSFDISKFRDKKVKTA